MKIPIFQIDAFAGKLFTGNPAAVCPLDKWLPDDLMQKIAAENNLAETAFFVPINDHFEIKWFTPQVEINLCGHATLASGHVLFRHLGYQGDRIKFLSKSGELIVTMAQDLIFLNFPADKPGHTTMPPGLVDGLGAKPHEILKGRDYFAVFDSENEIIAIKPNFDRLCQIESHAIIVTAPGQTCDFVSRFFAPRLGINEDPVTGSAHTALIPYWAEKLGKKLMTARQLSKRQGEIFCENLGNRVLIGGYAKTYMTGEIEL